MHAKPTNMERQPAFNKLCPLKDASEPEHYLEERTLSEFIPRLKQFNDEHQDNESGSSCTVM